MRLTPETEELIELIKKALDDPNTTPEMASELREEWSGLIDGCWLDEEDDDIEPERR